MPTGVGILKKGIPATSSIGNRRGRALRWRILDAFLRFECAPEPFVEPHFSNGYLDAGGTLPADRRFLSRVRDLVGLLKDLAHGNLSGSAALKAVALIQGTLDDRDHVLT